MPVLCAFAKLAGLVCVMQVQSGGVVQCGHGTVHGSARVRWGWARCGTTTGCRAKRAECKVLALGPPQHNTGCASAIDTDCDLLLLYCLQTLTVLPAALLGGDSSVYCRVK